MATSFEGYSHQQLRAMIASLDPVAVKDRADRLSKAADDIAKIGEKLKGHRVSGWEGSGATDFQEWVGRAGNATLRLSEYSTAGSKWMGEAVQKMTEASNMPAYDTGAAADLEAARKFHNDPDAQQTGQKAQAKLTADHNESVRLMNSLAQSYEHSSTQMNMAEIPTFPPPPAALVPPNIDSGGDMARPGGGAYSGGASSGGSSYAPSSGTGGAPSGEPGWVPGHQPQPGNSLPPTTGSVSTPLPGIPDHNVDVGLDHVGTLPNPTLPPTTVTPGGPLPTGPGAPGVNPGPFVPPVTLPPIGGLKTPGGGPGLGGPFPGVSGPLGKVGGPGGVPGLPLRDTGIVGGRPVSTTGPGAGIPRGTVIGGEGAQAGRGMGGMGGGLGGPHGGAGGSSMGRRLAMEPGGVVGGRQSGTVGRPTTGGQPFTQGGSGLVRNNARGTGVGAGAMGAGAGAHAPSRRREDQGGERPDYLAEDEETWQGNRRVVPPVVD